MRLVTMILSIVVAVSALLLAAPPADAQSCQQLWVERNSYYKRHGYCFKTQARHRLFRQCGLQIS